jgi:uncharacterized RDD family membrane protein YckC
MSPHPHGNFRTQNIEWQARLQGVALASFKARALAFLIDASLIALVLLAPSFWALATAHGPARTFELELEFGGLASVAIAVGYFGLATYLGKGATIGKHLLGIRVVSLVHSHMSLWHSIERALGYTASSLEAGFGFLQYFNHPNHQTVHDRIAETIVVVSRTPKRSRST